ncbi:fatty-acid amide hydrolase [Grosmannia clavigera kw1407]|uniref:amidase n=1 Tax=Grosmannia clavigera (strain kw1407 / UAMH 11150) TaxID=655863 RepID=F0X6N2_GROCL|nr:fatty-acid amide hydrolase [Grosmannia clavigera kw1407]EFX06659.1 fatty-acid amide hydrolase [Grosmannia clavigera kw1407]
MASPSFITIQAKALPLGTAEFESKKAAVLDAFAKKVPREYWLPETLIRNPPTDVSGIPATCGILSAEEIHITEDYDAVALAAAIAERKLSAVAVVTAFAKRAIIAHQLTNCLTQWWMDEAIEQAAALDKYQAENDGRTLGPLHGVPISIKDHVPIANTFSSAGCLATVSLDAEDCQITASLRRAGAVFYCKTNQPQTLMHLESDSLWGRVLNPFHIGLSAGGSSGGEAALLAMKGSVLGLGTDIGGSVRGPACFCGIYGFKSTSYRLPTRNFLPTTSAAELNVVASTGPMGRSMRDLDLFMTAVLGPSDAPAPHLLLDLQLVPIPWTGLATPRGPKPLKVGIIAHDGFITPQPPVTRAIAWARERLADPRLAGLIEVKPFTPFGASEGWNLVRKIYWPDGGQASRDVITSTGEPLHPLSDWIWKDEAPDGMTSAAAVNDLRQKRNKFRYDFAQSWQDQDVDVVLGPGFVGPASAHDSSFYWTYTSLYNLVDYPGVSIPTPVKVQAGEHYDSSYVPLSDPCKHVKTLWEASSFEGAPIALQLVARKHRDNELFGAMAVLKDALDLP